MKQIINYIKNSGIKQVVLIGDVMLDEYIFGSAYKISPEAPVPVIKEESREWSLGAAANVAANCKNIGLDVKLIGIVNDEDYSGKKIISLLDDANIAIDGLVYSSSRITTNRKRIIAGQQQCVCVDRYDAHSLSIQERSALFEKIDKFVKPETLIMVSDHAKGVVDETIIDYLVSLAHKQRCRVIVDPEGPHFDMYANVDYLKPNLDEFQQMIHHFGLSPARSMIENGRAICSLLEIAGIFVTMGENGIRYISNENQIYARALKREVSGLTGSGDTVFAFLGLAFAHKITIEKSIKLANAAAAVAGSHFKTYAVSIDELIDKDTESCEKIIDDWARLKIELDWLRGEGNKVVFTYGCFDFLTLEHIYMLHQAKLRGETLVVALNTNNAGGPLSSETERLINTLSERAQIVAALGCVDFVIDYDQNTPLEIINYLEPDVLVIGGNCKIADSVDFDTVMQSGGEVHVIDHGQSGDVMRPVQKMRQSSL